MVVVPGHLSLPNSDPAVAAIASPTPTDNTPEYTHSFPTSQIQTQTWRGTWTGGRGQGQGVGDMDGERDMDRG